MTLEEIKNYLRIDFNDDDIFLTELIEVSQIYIDKCVGEEYKADEKCLKLSGILHKKFISEMYETRSPVVSEKMKQDITVTTILDILSNVGSDEL